MVSTPVKEIKNAEWYLTKDKKYFLREFSYIKPMIEEEHKIAKNLHDFAKRGENIKLLEEIESQLKKLERMERWQQMRSRFPKLRTAMSKLINSPYISVDTKKKIEELLPQFEVWENDLLEKTKKELDPLLKDKTLNQIQWDKVVQITERLVRDIQDLLVLDERLNKLIGG